MQDSPHDLFPFALTMLFYDLLQLFTGPPLKHFIKVASVSNLVKSMLVHKLVLCCGKISYIANQLLVQCTLHRTNLFVKTIPIGTELCTQKMLKQFFDEPSLWHPQQVLM
jgi:hypothetical protein